jgi:hypothetical protein
MISRQPPLSGALAVERVNMYKGWAGRLPCRVTRPRIRDSFAVASGRCVPPRGFRFKEQSRLA